MKKLIKKIFLIVIILAVTYFLLNIFIATAGKNIAASLIEKNFNRKTSLKSLNIGFPLSINIGGLEIENFLKAPSISVSPNILGFFFGKIVLGGVQVTKPLITIEKKQDGSLDIPLLAAGSGKPAQIFLTGLKVAKGKFIFTDKSFISEGFRVFIDDINIDINKAVLPLTSLNTKFNLSAMLVNAGSEPKGKATASGWIDFGPKNMEGNFELKDIEINYIEPYCKNLFFIKISPLAKLNFTSEAKAKNNDLLAKCRMEISSLVPVKSKGEEVKEPASIADLFSSAVDIFSDSSGNQVFNFTIKTKLDNPRFDFQGTIAQGITQNITANPENTIEKVKKAAEQFKDFGKNFEDIFKNKE